ncbi:MAG: lysophospholipase [Prevotella sp.]|jgi:alpha-beta hydrolase superfamily lysophospholipase|nr:lysophospholipase [Prevotella sp.]
MTKKRKKLLKITLGTIITIFILINIVIIIQAYSLTHFAETKNPLRLGYEPNFVESVEIAVFGAKISRPKVKGYPQTPYENHFIPAGNDEQLGAWLLHTDTIKQGLVIAFHGYMEEKSSMRREAALLLKMGYDVLLVDFMGAGSSYGVQTTIGSLESENVKSAYDYAINELKEDKIILLGFSMGGAAILKAQHDYNMVLKGLIVEASYGTFQGTINKRLDMLNIPHWPASSLFTFWIGAINGFNGFDCNPQEYAQKIHVPVLLMCGQNDKYIPPDETQLIFDQLASEDKQLVLLPNSDHESYLNKDKKKWVTAVHTFLAGLENMDVYNN